MPRTSHLLSLDAGTTGIRAILYDRDLRPVRSSYSEFRQHFPAPGWVEHDAGEILRVAIRTLRDAARGVDPRRILGLGITNQRETLVAWDAKTMRPLHRAIVWQCRRTAQMCATLRAGGAEPAIRRMTGLVLDPYFSASKIRWLDEHVADVRAARRTGRLRFGTVDSWLTAALTGSSQHYTDPSNASRTMLYDIGKRRWDEALCALFRADPDSLPQVRSSAGFFGFLRKEILGRPIPITGIAGDQQAALYGQGCWGPGATKNTYGTGCFLMANLGTRRRDVPGLLTTLACDEKGGPAFALEGAVFIGGAVVQWLRDGLGLIENSSEIEALARSVPDAGGVTLVPAFVGLGAPYWDAQARGAILGITRGTNRAHVARAALESIVFQSAELFELFSKSGIRAHELRVDGGACRNDLLMQMQANALGVPVLRPRQLETTALGAAALAAVGSGVWDRPSQAKAFREPRRKFLPRASSRIRAAQLASWKAAVRRVLSPTALPR